MKLSLNNLTKVYEEVTNRLVDIKDKDICVVIGFTGSGKSTLLSALVDGPQSLVNHRVKKKFVINHRSEESSTFKIGHNAAKSETFLPRVGQDPQHKDLYYVDIAGQDDNRGDLIEIMNSFIANTVFHRSKSVRFLVTIDRANITQLRGQRVREIFAIISGIFSYTDLKSMTPSIQLIMTKASKDNDIDVIRGDLEEQIKADVEHKQHKDISNLTTDEEKE